MKLEANATRKIVEIILGPLPPTVLILPFGVGGLIGNIIAFFAIAADPDFGGGHQTTALANVFWQIASGLCVVVGLFALWVAVLFDARSLRSRGALFLGLLVALFLGAIQAMRWLLLILSSDYSLSTTLLWVFLTVAPLLVAGSRIVQMLRGHRCAA